MAKAALRRKENSKRRAKALYMWKYEEVFRKWLSIEELLAWPSLAWPVHLVRLQRPSGLNIYPSVQWLTWLILLGGRQRPILAIVSTQKWPPILPSAADSLRASWGWLRLPHSKSCRLVCIYHFTLLCLSTVTFAVSLCAVVFVCRKYWLFTLPSEADLRRYGTLSWRDAILVTAAFIWLIIHVRYVCLLLIVVTVL